MALELGVSPHRRGEKDGVIATVAGGWASQLAAG